ncbi:bacillithiol system redox-active protein YtxJ [Mangrovimonas sp. DI 80]|uniref:bacillithiol system redox-active protein YtxJ n=1 Tax=Mangrovimonas sp. DI 80 TaxID=1779330 RepID=UPI000977E89A|nr:bacillithiol system redox-active protein YtxJ [Mangrovimonas sp. DI 80]OMP29763.1 cytosolic protein [Mangrovimonas sp. DI 80]
MGFIKKLFGGSEISEESKEVNTMPWLGLTSVEQLNKLKVASETKPQLIFKHSTRCGVSRMVMRQFEESYGFSNEDFDVYYLDLLNYRDVSNVIASMFQVMHQSPQLLVIKNGVVVAHASHGAILDVDLKNFV